MLSKNFISLKNFKKKYPLCYERYVKSGGENYLSLNSALDSLLFHYGIGVVLKSVYKGEKCAGYKSDIKIYPDNKIKEREGSSEYIGDFKKFRKPEKATKVTTLKALEILEDALHFRGID